MRKLKNKKGFTLAELLIVVAIIAVLVGISIPVFGAQLKKAHFAVDLANVRAKYAEVLSEQMLSDAYVIDPDTGEVTLELTGSDISEVTLKANGGYGSTVTFPAAADDPYCITVELGSFEETFDVDTDVTFN